MAGIRRRGLVCALPCGRGGLRAALVRPVRAHRNPGTTDHPRTRGVRQFPDSANRRTPRTHTPRTAQLRARDQRVARLTAETTAFSEARVVFASMPMPHRTLPSIATSMYEAACAEAPSLIVCSW